MSAHELLTRTLQAGDHALQQGDWGTALRCGRTAVALSPGHAATHSLLGLALLQLGEIAEAVTELEQAAHLDRNNAALLGNLGQTYGMAGRHADAHQAFRRAQRLAPAHWPYVQGAAIALAQQGKAAEAETLLRRLTQRHPHEAAPWYNLGNVQLALDKPADAEQSLLTALRLVPDDVDTRLSLGSALHRQSRFAEAEAAYRSCIAAQPQWPAPRLNLVSVLIDDGRFNAAEHECATLIAQNPELPEAHRFLGAALGQQGKIVPALAAYRAGAALTPDDATAQRILGGALAECGHLHEGLRVLARAAAMGCDVLELQQLLGMVYLAHGLYADGWAAYRSRPAHVRLSAKWADAGIAQTLPDDLDGKQILVRREQGLGDELFFLRQLPLLKTRGARVSVYASAKIAGMIRRAGIADEVTADSAPPPAIAVQILCGDLPHALQPCPATPLRWNNGACAVRDYPFYAGAFFPQPLPSLRIPVLPEAVERVRGLLRNAGAPPYIGITWRAGTAAREQLGADWVLSKEIPLAALGAALRPVRGTLLALQRHPASGEIDALAAACGRPVADFTGLNEQLEDMYALLEQIDDYIGVSNTNMHLRAAAGRAARVLVPNPAEWRWMYWGERSPWFPDFRIYRQSLRGDWSPALAALARDLAATR